ncbi:hypothetical protein CZ787_17655 [Halomonas citrativorans]|uniref:Uncharacterized protein n=1 Tax=Halomonas citrativorans TaxID=2742612 RepID=A0A1R4I5B5_9GAMM|nr:hypothetical protein CZ787_17655 [Halomonas citrativorans]
MIQRRSQRAIAYVMVGLGFSKKYRAEFSHAENQKQQRRCEAL